jgi:hypothetical protein
VAASKREEVMDCGRVGENDPGREEAIDHNYEQENVCKEGSVHEWEEESVRGHGKGNNYDRREEMVHESDSIHDRARGVAKVREADKHGPICETNHPPGMSDSL